MSARRPGVDTAAGWSRRRFLGTAAAAAAAAWGFPALASPRPKGRNVIVLGIDGMDPTLCARFLREGRLPNLRRLAEQGCFGPLRTTEPPQSPVAWSSFISGTNPGGHGIFDFIARDPATLTPYLSTARLRGEPRTLPLGRLRIPLASRQMENLRKGPTFWSTLGSRGVDCTVIAMPTEFPPTPTRGRTLSGLGTPDIHGSYGIFTLYTDSRSERSRDVAGGHIERVGVENWTVRSAIRGPVNTLNRDEPQVDLPLAVHVDPTNPVAHILVQDHDLVLQQGEWSPWVSIRFPLLGPLAGVSGICRFYLKRVRDPFQLYLSPVNIDPEDPAMPVSSPERYARGLAEALGPFYTQGMAEDTSALSAGALDDSEYRQQATYVLDEDLRMFAHEFGRFREGFFFFYFSSLDLNSHAFWRAMDTGHPAYTPELAAAHGDFLPWLYGRMDEVVGEAMKRLDERTLLMVISDHGFGSFRRQFNLNAWLMDHGYAAPVRGATRGTAGYFADADWPRTRAYGLGINGLYLNLKGREPEGAVAQGAEQDELGAELIARLRSVRDPLNGEPVITNVYRPREIYSGPFVSEAPDLIVCYNANYRASWDTILGKYPRDHILDNKDPWSGDHAMDSQFMSGVLFSSRRIRSDSPALWDLAPTILREFGATPPPGMTGECVL